MAVLLPLVALVGCAWSDQDPGGGSPGLSDCGQAIRYDWQRYDEHGFADPEQVGAAVGRAVQAGCSDIGESPAGVIFDESATPGTEVRRMTGFDPADVLVVQQAGGVRLVFLRVGAPVSVERALEASVGG